MHEMPTYSHIFDRSLILTTNTPAHDLGPQIIPKTLATHPAAPLSNRYQIAATSDNTRRAYQADIRHFEAWGGQLPATTEAILRYLHAFADTLNPRTLSRHVTALKQWHRYQHFLDPTEAPIISKTLIGIARIHGKPK